LIYVILGLHKSGTTLTARLLHQAGIDMGPATPGESYDAGDMFERPETKAINKQLLGVDHNKWLRTYPRDNLAADPALRARADRLVAAMGDGERDWGFKDPRTALTYGFWAAVLPPHRIIAIYREPSALWLRTRRTFGRKWHQNPVRAYRLLARWLEHNARVRDIVRARPEVSLLLSYDRLMDTPAELARLSAFVGRSLPDRRDAALHRGRTAWTPLLRAARPLAQQRTGCRVDALTAELDALRAEQIAADSGPGPGVGA
jgi:hypothetical protein